MVVALDAARGRARGTGWRVPRDGTDCGMTCRAAICGRDDGSRRLGGRDDQVLLGELGARLEQPVAAHLLRRGTGLGVGVEQRQQARVPGRDLREDRRDAVESLEQVGAGRRRDRGVLTDPGALRAHEQGHDEELRSVRRAGLALAGDAGLHLADPAREHGDERGRFVPALGRLSLAVVLDLLRALAVGRSAADARCHVPPDDAEDVERAGPPGRHRQPVSAADSARVPVDAPSRARCPERRTGGCAADGRWDTSTLQPRQGPMVRTAPRPGPSGQGLDERAVRLVHRAVDAPEHDRVRAVPEQAFEPGVETSQRVVPAAGRHDGPDLVVPRIRCLR